MEQTRGKGGESPIRQKSFAFALRIVKLSQSLVVEKKEFVLSRQLLRSGTAIGALVRDAQRGESTADFVHKLAIALKEANETEYWLDLLHQSGYVEDDTYLSHRVELVELLKLLTSIIKSTRGKQ